MSRQGRTTFLVLAAVYFLAILVSAGHSFFTFPGLVVVPAFRVGWIIWNSVVVFVALFPTVHLTGILLLYSLFISRQPSVRTADQALLASLRGSLVLCTVVAMLFAVVVGIGQPYAVGRRDRYVFQSRFAQALLTQGENSFERGEYDRAVNDFALVLRLIPEDDEVRTLLEQARSRQEPTPAPEAPVDDVAFVTAAVREGPDAISLAVRAREALEREDMFSAHYYARLALALDPEIEEARLTLTNAYEGMRSYGPTIKEQRERRLYDQKQAAVTALTAEDNGRRISAYHAFADLRASHPDDPDVVRYYPLALEAVREVSFFLDELEQSMHFPDHHNLTFRNGRDAATREFVHIDRLIVAVDGFFAHGIEAVSFDATGTILYHLRADYGKVIERNADDSVAWLNMRAVDRERRTILVPEYLVGAREKYVEHLLELRVPVDRLELIAANGSGLSDRAVPDLLQQSRLHPEFGFPVAPVRVEIAMRLLWPFSLLVFSLFGIAVGLKSHYLGRPRMVVVAAIIVLPLVLHQAIQLYLYAYRVVLGFVMLTAGQPVAILVLVVSQALLLAWALFAMAAQLAST